jgi:hypothetical protein
MQQTTHNLGHRKHRQAFGKSNRNPSNNMRTAMELNRATEDQQKQRARKKNQMYQSLTELFRG